MDMVAKCPFDVPNDNLAVSPAVSSRSISSNAKDSTAVLLVAPTENESSETGKVKDDES